MGTWIFNPWTHVRECVSVSVCAFRDKDTSRQGEPKEPSKQTSPNGSWKYADWSKGSQTFFKSFFCLLFFFKSFQGQKKYLTVSFINSLGPNNFITNYLLIPLWPCEKIIQTNLKKEKMMFSLHSSPQLLNNGMCAPVGPCVFQSGSNQETNHAIIWTGVFNIKEF